jgi:hypothetical protein
MISSEIGWFVVFGAAVELDLVVAVNVPSAVFRSSPSFWEVDLFF